MITKLKAIYQEYREFFIDLLALFVTTILIFFGFERGVAKERKNETEKDIDLLHSKNSEAILKEKLADKDKSIYEISSDVDNILDRK